MNINLSNYKNYLLGYIDNQIDADTRANLEKFIASHPSAKNELYALKATKLIPDKKIVFPDKQRLFREEETSVYNTEEEAPLRKLFWYRATAVAAAAMLAGLVVWLSFFHNSRPNVIPSRLSALETPSRQKVALEKPAKTGRIANAPEQKPTKDEPRLSAFATRSRRKVWLPTPKKIERVVNAPEQSIPEQNNPIQIIPDNPTIAQTKPDTFVAATNKIGLQTPEKKPLFANAPERKKGLLHKIGGLLGARIRLKTKDADGNSFYAIEIEMNKINISTAVKR